MQPNFTAFNGYDLSQISPYLEFDRRDANQTPKRNLDMEDMARTSGKKLLGAKYGERIIPLTGHVKAPDRASADAVRDAIIMRLQATQANLDIVVAGALRTYQATYSSDVWTNVEGGLVVFTFNFTAADPFGFDSYQTTLNFSNPLTAAVNDTVITWGGSWYAEPILAVALASGTGLTTNKTLSISNPDTGESISVTRNWAANDTLVLNSVNRTVSVNSIQVDYSGVFPRWFPGSGTIRISDDFTTRSISASGSYVRRWL